VLFICLFLGTDKNCNFSAVRSPIELKIDGDLGLVIQVSVHVLVPRFNVFSYYKKRKKKEGEIEEKSVFRKLDFSLPFQVRLI
jgi:hypothetical protein